MDSPIEKDGTQLWNNNLAHPRLSFSLKNNNMAWSFVGKLEQVSTSVLWKIPLYQNYKRKKVKYSSTQAFDCSN